MTDWRDDRVQSAIEARRISVVGTSGSGKSTLARALATSLSVPYVELDALHWGPDWRAATAEELRAAVLPVVQGSAWVVDGNYRGKIGTLVWEYAEAVVWLDPPRHRVMWQSIKRTLRRILTREELWAGNREDWRGLMFWRGEDSILRWAWTSFGRNRERYEAAMADPQFAHLRFYRLRSRRDVRRFCSRVGRDSLTPKQ